MRIDLSQLEFIDPQLREMALYMEMATGLELTITSLYRPGDPGVHGTTPLRGIDFRCRKTSLGSIIADQVNRKWIYDPERPDMKCAIFHVGTQAFGSAPHIHLQVHPNTRLRGTRREASDNG